MKKNVLFKKPVHIRYLLLGVFIWLTSISFYSCITGNENSDKKATELSVSTNVAVSGTNFFGPNASQVPHDVANAADSTQYALSVFAWKEFIALNWPSTYDAKNNVYTRAVPYTGDGALNKFLMPENTGKLVWQTYKHRVEMYPKDTTNYNTNFDTAPKYVYDKEISGLSSSTLLRNVDTIFNNLDETSEINLCTLFVEGDPNAPGASDYPNAGIASGLPGAPRRMIYEAKGNRAMFEYVVKNKLYDSIIRAKKINNTEIAITQDGKGAIYQENPDPNTIVFPFGNNDTGGSEGSIEIKATWRQLTLKEYQSGRYLTAPIIYYRGGKPQTPNPNGPAYYDVVPAKPTYDVNNNLKTLPYGLVGLHIIHKTKTFPSYVFATFEQVDNLSREIEPLNTLFYYNRNENPFISSGRQNVYTRSNPILADTKKVNDSVHAQIKKLNPKSVWQYYKLIGVQGHPAQNDNTTDYYLANIVTETNAVLANFSGTLDTLRGTKDPKGINVYRGQGKIVQGGCKGCHGNAQKSDFSFITQNAPIVDVDFINQPLLKKDQN